MAENKVYKPIRYFGSKGNFYKKILDFFPNKEDYNIYIEPFGGSYTCGLMADLPEKVCEIYNDLEDNVYSLYKVISDKDLFPLFKERCGLITYNDTFRGEFKEKLKNNDLNIIVRAFYFFYVNRTSHNGIGGFSMNTSIRRNISKSVSDLLSTIDNLPELHQRLSKVLVCNKNGIDLIERYNTENVFLYCDPPYVQSTRSSNTKYLVEMDDDTHKQFLDACIKSKAKILISGYDNEIYNKLNDNGFEKISFEIHTTTGTHEPKVKTETVWKNY